VTAANALALAGFNRGAAPTLPRNIRLVRASGLQLPLLVPSTSIAVNKVINLQNATALNLPGSTLAAEFDALLNVWKAETQFLSGANIELHPAYQRIIGLGKPALPFILRDLKATGDHWFWALEAITGEDPAMGTNSIPAAAAAWIHWGERHGLI